MAERERGRTHTRKGPGRMPFTKTSSPAGTKLWNKCPIKRPDAKRRPEHV